MRDAQAQKYNIAYLHPLNKRLKLRRQDAGNIYTERQRLFQLNNKSKQPEFSKAYLH